MEAVGWLTGHLLMGRLWTSRIDSRSRPADVPHGRGAAARIHNYRTIHLLVQMWDFRTLYPGISCSDLPVLFRTIAWACGFLRLVSLCHIVESTEARADCGTRSDRHGNPQDLRAPALHTLLPLRIQAGASVLSIILSRESEDRLSFPGRLSSLLHSATFTACDVMHVGDNVGLRKERIMASLSIRGCKA